MVNFGPRKSSVPRYTRKYQSIGPWSGLRSGENFATIGAQGGAWSILSEITGRLGDHFIEKGLKERELKETASARQKGFADAEAASKGGMAVQLRLDETLAAQAYNEALKEGYLASLDTMVSEKANQMFLEHGDDPEAFDQRWEAMTSNLSERLPQAWQPALRLELNRRKVRYTTEIASKVHAEALAGANADLLRGHVLAEQQAFRYWRAGNPELAAEQEGKFRHFLDKRTDLTPQEKEKALLNYERRRRGETVLGEFERSMAGGLEQAETFLTEFKETTTKTLGQDEGEALTDAMDEALKEARKQHRSLTERRAEQEAAGEIIDLGLNRSKSLAKARTIKDPKLRDLVVARVNKRFDEVAKAEKEQRQEALKAAGDHLDIGGTIDTIPPEIWGALDRKEQQALRKSTTDRQTDLETYYRLKRMSPEAFRNHDLLADRQGLSVSDFKKLADDQARLKQGDVEASGKWQGFRSEMRLVEDTLRQIGLPQKANSQERAERREAFMRAYQDRRSAFTHRNDGREPNDQEAQGILDAMLIEGHTKRDWWFDEEKRLWEVTPDEEFSVNVEDVPTGERRKIEAALEQAGYPVTDENITALYAKKLKTLQGGPDTRKGG